MTITMALQCKDGTECQWREYECEAPSVYLSGCVKLKYKKSDKSVQR